MASSKGPAGAVFVARHGERVDYQWARDGKNWAAQAARPWDSPLTPAGVRQGEALGRAVERHRISLKLPKFAAVYSSPLFRCVQTAAAAAAALGVDRIRIEPRLAEGMCEEWYRSWGVKDADTTWGGPKHAPMGSPVDAATLHPFATKPASACHGTAPWLKQQLEQQNPELAAKVTVDVADAVDSTHAFTWGAFESEADLGPRMRTVFESNCERGVGAAPILLCSHGGPTTHAYSEMSGGKKLEGKVGYTGLFVYLPPDGGAGAVWSTPVVADGEHLKEVPEGTASGPNDASEQAAALAADPVASAAAAATFGVGFVPDDDDDDDDGGGLAALMGGDLGGDSDADADFEAGDEEEDLEIEDASDDDNVASTTAKKPRLAAPGE